MATEVAQLIFKADTSQLKSAEKQVDSLGAKTQKTSNNTQAFGRKAGMASIQVEQLVGQIAGGQNPMRAFGVQAADLGFVLGVPLLGSVVAVSAAFLSMIPSLASSEDQSKTLSEEVKALTTNLYELTDAQKASVAVQFAKEISDIEKTNRGLNRQIALQVEEVESLTEKYERGQFQLGKWAVTQEEFEAQLKKEKGELDTLRGALDSNNQSIERMQGILDGTVGSTQEYIDSLREESIVLGMNARQKALYTAQAQGATDAQLAEINATFDLIDVKNQAIEQQKQEIAAQKESEQIASRKAASDKRAAESAARRFENESAAASANAEKLAMLQLEEDDRETKRFENQILRLQEQKQKQLITEQEYQDALAGIVAERSRDLTDIQIAEQKRLADAKQEQQEKDEEIRKKLYEKEVNQRALQTDMMLAFDDQLLKGKSDTTKAAYRIGVNLMNQERQENAKQIISSSYTAAMGAYESLAPIPIVGPALGAAAAGTILAAGVSFAAKSLAGRALGGQVRAGESYVVGERGPEVLTMGGSNGRITTNEALRGNNQSNNETNVSNVSFNITANDSRGFDELLQSRRGTIVSMINKAMANKGKRAIV